MKYQVIISLEQTCIIKNMTPPDGGLDWSAYGSEK